MIVNPIKFQSMMIHKSIWNENENTQTKTLNQNLTLTIWQSKHQTQWLLNSKLLGITIDKKLKFGDHITDL